MQKTDMAAAQYERLWHAAQVARNGEVVVD